MKKSTKPKIVSDVWDVVVIGAGPAGMMAAATAAARNLSVLILEKNQQVGKKLLITGGGRCNVTNNKPVVRTLASKYKAGEKFLYSAFSQHAVPETIEWFLSRGVTFVEENEGRLFPATHTAQTIWDTVVAELQATKVTVHSGIVVTAIDTMSNGTFVITSRGKKSIYARSVIVATGGTSRPETGSTGDGFRFLEVMGHTVVLNNYALVPVTTKEPWVKTLAGVSLTDVKVSIYADSKKHSASRGKMLFTHVGLSGPLILNQSRTIGELLAHASVSLHIDLLPDVDAGGVKALLQAHLTTASNKKIKNVISELIPSQLVTPVLQCIAIDPETPSHSVRKEDRVKIAQIIKALSLTVTGLLGPDKAVVSAGGVVPEEIDFKTMQSRLVPGLFVVGDLLNIDRPSGGYSLQLCWSTGFVAGSHV